MESDQHTGPNGAAGLSTKCGLVPAKPVLMGPMVLWADSVETMLHTRLAEISTSVFMGDVSSSF